MIIDPEDFCAVEASATPGRWNVLLHPATTDVAPITVDSLRSKAAADERADDIRALFATWLVDLGHEALGENDPNL